MVSSSPHVGQQKLVGDVHVAVGDARVVELGEGRGDDNLIELKAVHLRLRHGRVHDALVRAEQVVRGVAVRPRPQRVVQLVVATHGVGDAAHVVAENVLHEHQGSGRQTARSTNAEVARGGLGDLDAIAHEQRVSDGTAIQDGRHGARE